MIYFETGNFKRYVKEIKDKSKNSKTGVRKVQQLNITGLSKNSKFEDGQKLVLIDYTEFTKHLEDFQNQETKINDLTQKLEEAKLTITELEGKLDKTPETVSNTNKIIDLVDKLEEKQTIIDNHKNIILQANDKVNTLIDDVTTELTNYFTNGVNTANLDTQVRVTNLLRDIKEVNKSNLKLLQDVQDQVSSHNTNYEKSNKIKKFFMKKINIDFEGLETSKELLTEFNSIDIEDTAKNITKSFTIDGAKLNEIKNNTKSKKLDFSRVFLPDKTSPEDDKDITINDTEETPE